MRTQLHKSTKFHLNKFNFFAIPLMAFAGIITLGILAVNQDADPNASATNTTSITGTVSYDDEYITITNSANVDLGVMSVTADNTYAYASDNVTVSTNVPTGYELYVSSVNNSSAALTTANSNDKINATSGTGGELGTPATLDANSYGYAVASEQIGNTNFDASYASPTSSSKFAAIPAGHSDRLRTTNTAVTDGETTNVYYGASVNNAIVPGTYTGQVVYSAVATPTKGTVEMSVSPKLGAAAGGTTLTIISGPTTINTASSLSADEVEVYFRQNGITKGACTVTNVTVANTGVTTTCTTPALSAGSYDVVISIPRYGFKDLASSAHVTLSANMGTLKSVANTTGITSMQDSLFSSVCDAATTWASGETDLTLTDSRDSSTYTVRKLADGHCWMVQNLRIMGKTLTTADSDVSGDFTLPSENSSWCNKDNADCYDTIKVYYDNNTTYGAYYNWYTATAGSGKYSTYGGVVNYSICPKGWKLPLGDTATIDYSWQYLYSQYYSPNFQPATLTGADYWAGSYSGSLNSGSMGIWWSRTAMNNWLIVYGLMSYASNDFYLDQVRKNTGASVRCVFVGS